VERSRQFGDDRSVGQHSPVGHTNEREWVEIGKTVVQTAETAAESGPPLAVELTESLADLVIAVVVLVEPQA
jgi:hypothetical protein